MRPKTELREGKITSGFFCTYRPCGGYPQPLSGMDCPYANPRGLVAFTHIASVSARSAPDIRTFYGNVPLPQYRNVLSYPQVARRPIWHALPAQGEALNHRYLTVLISLCPHAVQWYSRRSWFGAAGSISPSRIGLSQRGHGPKYNGCRVGFSSDGVGISVLYGR